MNHPEFLKCIVGTRLQRDLVQKPHRNGGTYTLGTHHYYNITDTLGRVQWLVARGLLIIVIYVVYVRRARRIIRVRRCLVVSACQLFIRRPETGRRAGRTARVNLSTLS